MQQHLSEISLLGPSALVLILLLAVNIGLTLVHSLQELNGRQWRYLGAIAGLCLPDWVGFLFFFLALTATLWALGLAGLAGYLPFYGPLPAYLSVGAVGALIGGRFSDRYYNHVLPDRQGYRPNPGLSSTPYYVVEAVLMTILFFPGLQRHFIAAAVGIVFGWLLFYSVLPLLRTLRVIRAWRCEPWQVGIS
jgi:hypothetical protein